MSEVELLKALRAVSGLQIVGWSVGSCYFSSFRRGVSCVPTKTERWNEQIMEVGHLTLSWLFLLTYLHVIARTDCSYSVAKYRPVA